MEVPSSWSNPQSKRLTTEPLSLEPQEYSMHEQELFMHLDDQKIGRISFEISLNDLVKLLMNGLQHEIFTESGSTSRIQKGRKINIQKEKNTRFFIILPMVIQHRNREKLFDFRLLVDINKRNGEIHMFIASEDVCRLEIDSLSRESQQRLSGRIQEKVNQLLSKNNLELEVAKRFTQGIKLQNPVLRFLSNRLIFQFEATLTMNVKVSMACGKVDSVLSESLSRSPYREDCKLEVKHSDVTTALQILLFFDRERKSFIHFGVRMIKINGQIELLIKLKNSRLVLNQLSDYSKVQEFAYWLHGELDKMLNQDLNDICQTELDAAANNFGQIRSRQCEADDLIVETSFLLTRNAPHGLRQLPLLPQSRVHDAAPSAFFPLPPSAQRTPPETPERKLQNERRYRRDEQANDGNQPHPMRKSS